LSEGWGEVGMVDDSGDLRIEGVLEVKENLPEQNLDQNALLDQFLDTVHNINQLLKEFDPILLLPGVNAQVLRSPMADLNMPQFQNPIINNGFGGGFGNIANDNFARAPAPQASARQNNFGAGNFYAESLVRQGDQAHMWTDHRPQYSGGVAHDPYHVKQQSHIFKDPYADLFKSVDHKPLFKSEYPDPIKPPKTNFGNDHSYSQFNSWHTPNLKPRFDSPSSFSSFSSSSFSESSNLASRINLANSESSLKTLEWDLKELKSKYPKQSFWNLENDMALKKSQLRMENIFGDHAQFGNPNNFQWDFKHENKEQKAEDFQNFEGVGATMGDYKIPNYNSAEYQKGYQRNSESGREESEPLPRKSAAGAGGGSGGDDGDADSEGNNDNYTKAEFEAKLRRSLMRIINNFNIREHEGDPHGGHTIERHIAKLIEWLETRAKTENVNGATSFVDEKTANMFILDILIRNFKDINEWMRDAKVGRTEPFYKRFDESTGYGFTKTGEQYFDNILGVRIVLVKTSGFTFRIYTAYPTDERFDSK